MTSRSGRFIFCFVITVFTECLILSTYLVRRVYVCWFSWNIPVSVLWLNSGCLSGLSSGRKAMCCYLSLVQSLYQLGCTCWVELQLEVKHISPKIALINTFLIITEAWNFQQVNKKILPIA